MRTLVLLGVMLFAAVGSAQPVEILIDFGSGAPTPTLGGTWNSTTSGDTTLFPVLGSSGRIVPGVIITTRAWTATGTMADPSHTWTKEWVDAQALADFVFIRGGNLSLVTIGGLPTGELYDVEVAVSAEPLSGSWIADYRVNFTDATVPPSDESSLSFDPEFDGRVQREILRWHGAGLDSTGDLDVSIHSMPPDYEGMISAMRVVPEPDTTDLMAAAAAGLLALSWGRRPAREVAPGQT